MHEMMARYEGTCAGCGKQIRAGSKIMYDPDKRLTYHAGCESAADIEAPYRVAGGSGYGSGGWTPGQVLRRPADMNQPDYITVVRVGKRYYSSDGMSFGVGDDAGYVYWADCRLATPEEVAAKRAEEEIANAMKRAKTRVYEIRHWIMDHGERPEDAGVVRGTVLLDTQDMYGGGGWFVLQPEAIWYVRNNGADGDNWAENNVRTGGAGAIGWRIPMDQALADELRSLDQMLSNED